MAQRPTDSEQRCQFDFANDFIQSIRSSVSRDHIIGQVEFAARQMGFNYYALIHHDDLRKNRADRIDLKRYPSAVIERLISQSMYRRDPVIRGCEFSPGAFLWSELGEIIQLDRRDRCGLEFGAREGLNEGITIPFRQLGECPGSCTFAGTSQPDHAYRHLGAAQMIGIFAFQAVRRLIGRAPAPAPAPRLHPRPRDCVALAGRGLSNKEIARALAITPRTVDGYLTEARNLFDVHDRTALVVDAVLAGEVGLHELRRQPE